MEITVKARFEAGKQRIEKYAPDQYIAYLQFKEDKDTLQVLRIVLSRYLGVPLARIQFKSRNEMKDHIFIIS